MQMQRPPTEIEHGWVYRMQYQPDFGRFEAAVVLRLIAGDLPARDVEVLTSVPAHSGEDEAALRRRIVLDAARLYRLSEAGVAAPDRAALAA
jgi:hypothetical protein